MDNQTAFDIAYKGIIAQGGPSVMLKGGETACLYRGENGRKCAIGHLIPDEMYTSDMDGEYSSLECAIQDSEIVIDFEFALDLQTVHDSLSRSENFIEEFKVGMAGLAAQYNLKVPEDGPEV
jgi:hypothetical protein